MIVGYTIAAKALLGSRESRDHMDLARHRLPRADRQGRPSGYYFSNHPQTPRYAPNTSSPNELGRKVLQRHPHQANNTLSSSSSTSLLPSPVRSPRSLFFTFRSNVPSARVLYLPAFVLLKSDRIWFGLINSLFS